MCAGNRLRGSIPAQWGSHGLSSLSNFKVALNDLHGSLPAAWVSRCSPLGTLVQRLPSCTAVREPSPLPSVHTYGPGACAAGMLTGQ